MGSMQCNSNSNSNATQLIIDQPWLANYRDSPLGRALQAMVAAASSNKSSAVLP